MIIKMIKIKIIIIKNNNNNQLILDIAPFSLIMRRIKNHMSILVVISIYTALSDT